MSGADTAADGWWNRRIVLWAAVLLSALPLAWPAVPPLYDLPDHLGRYHVMLDYGRSALLPRHWRFEWALVPNLGVDLIVMALAPLMGVVAATKLVVLAIPPLTVAGFFALSRAATGRVSPAIGFALPLAYAGPFQLGFVNFCLSAALALLAVAGWIALGRRETGWRRTLLFAPVAFLLWLAHSSGWGMFGVLALAAEWHRLRVGDTRAVSALFGAALRVGPLGFPLVLMLAGGTADGIGAEWQVIGKILWLLTLLRDRWQLYDMLSTAVILTAIYAGWRMAALRFNPLLSALALALLAIFLALPWAMVGGAYVDMRMLPFALAVLLLAIVPRTSDKAAGVGTLAMLGALFFVQRITATTVSFALVASAQTQAVSVLPSLPRGASVLTLVNERCIIEWNPNRFGHLGGMAIATRDAFTNSAWSLAGQQLVRSRMDGWFSADPSQMIRPRRCPEATPTLPQALARFDRRAFTHVWLLDFPDGHAVAADMTAIARAPRSALYRVEPSH